MSGLSGLNASIAAEARLQKIRRLAEKVAIQVGGDIPWLIVDCRPAVVQVGVLCPMCLVCRLRMSCPRCRMPSWRSGWRGVSADRGADRPGAAAAGADGGAGAAGPRGFPGFLAAAVVGQPV